MCICVLLLALLHRMCQCVAAYFSPAFLPCQAWPNIFGRSAETGAAGAVQDMACCAYPTILPTFGHFCKQQSCLSVFFRPAVFYCFLPAPMHFAKQASFCMPARLPCHGLSANGCAVAHGQYRRFFAGHFPDSGYSFRVRVLRH